MDIHVTPATREEKPILRNLLELYLHDTSDLDHSDVGPTGLFGYNYLDYYWASSIAIPFSEATIHDGAWPSFSCCGATGRWA